PTGLAPPAARAVLLCAPDGRGAPGPEGTRYSLGWSLSWSLGLSIRIFPAAISSSATVTGLLLATSTIGNWPSLRTRARLASLTTSAYLFSILASNDSSGGRIIMMAAGLHGKIFWNQAAG